jgi:chromate transport protein ChrA
LKQARSASLMTEEPTGATARDRSLARWAGACLAGTMLIQVGAFLLFFFAMASKRWMAAHAVTVAMAVVAVAAYFTSVSALASIQRSKTTEPRRLWRLSLACNVAIVATLAAGFGVKVGLVMCAMELVAIVLHLVALTAPAVPRRISTQ